MDARGFFAIDRRAWHKACDLGLNVAVAYLVLARGTQADNRTTAWSVQAIESRTGISRPRCGAAIQGMIAGKLALSVGKNAKRPRYYLVEGHKVITDIASLPPLTDEEELVWQQLPLKTVPKLPEAISTPLQQLKQKGYARLRGSVWEARPEVAEASDPRPQWIWLPNVLVDGLSGRASPVELLRQTAEIDSLRLLIDLYDAHALSFDHGVPSTLLSSRHSARRVCVDNTVAGWAFGAPQLQVHPAAPFYIAFKQRHPTDFNEQFWACIDTICRLGLVTIVEHVFEGSGDEAEVVYPFAEPLPGRDVTEAEAELYRAAKHAGTQMQLKYKSDAGTQVIVPVHRHIAAPDLRGVFRMRHRPHTAVTAEWMTMSGHWSKLATYWHEYARQVGTRQDLDTASGLATAA